MHVALKRFACNERGTVAVIFALALIPVLGMTGLGLDYAVALRADSKLQDAADAAALAAVITRVPTTTLRLQAAQAAFSANAPTGVNAVAIPSNVTSRTATVTATGAVATSVMQTLKIKTAAIGASATAVKEFAGPPPCIIALNPTASKAVLMTGSANYTANNCTIHSNSSAAPSLLIDNNTVIKGATFCAVGTTSVPTLSKDLARDYCEPVEDPFRNLVAPMLGSCIATNLEVSPNQTVTLAPGRYCGGLALKGNVTLSPGTYVIGGLLTITSQAIVKGDRVSFYLTGSSAGFTIDAGGSVKLTAPSSGSYSGVLFFQDRYANAGFTNTLTGGSNSTILGAIYTPTQTVRVSGGSSAAQGPAFMPIVADKVEVTGSISASAVSSTMPLPFPLPMTESGVRLVR
jgi:hypothetical protein